MPLFFSRFVGFGLLLLSSDNLVLTDSEFIVLGLLSFVINLCDLLGICFSLLLLAIFSLGFRQGMEGGSSVCNVSCVGRGDDGMDVGLEVGGLGFLTELPSTNVAEFDSFSTIHWLTFSSGLYKAYQVDFVT